MIVVYTALIGANDAIYRPQGYPDGTRYVCYTSRRASEIKGWERVEVEAIAGSERLQSRRIKHTPHLLFPDAWWSIWLDASFELKEQPRRIICEAATTGCDVVMLRHPKRNNIAEEAEAVKRGNLAPAAKVDAQIAAYAADGFDVGEAKNPLERRDVPRLSCCGFIVRRHTREVAEFNTRLLREIETHTARDQLSADYASWKTGVPIGYLPGKHTANAYFTFHSEPHARMHR